MAAERIRRAGVPPRSTAVSERFIPEHDDERRWGEIEAALGSLSDSGHEWNDDPPAWVRGQQRGGSRFGS